MDLEYKPFLEKAFSFWTHLLPSEQALILEKMQVLNRLDAAISKLHQIKNDIEKD